MVYSVKCLINCCFLLGGMNMQFFFFIFSLLLLNFLVSEAEIKVLEWWITQYVCVVLDFIDVKLIIYACYWNLFFVLRRRTDYVFVCGIGKLVIIQFFVVILLDVEVFWLFSFHFLWAHVTIRWNEKQKTRKGTPSGSFWHWESSLP